MTKQQAAIRKLVNIDLAPTPAKPATRGRAGKPVSIAFDLYVVQRPRKSDLVTRYEGGGWTTRYESGGAPSTKVHILDKVVEAAEPPKRRSTSGVPLTSDDYSSLAARWIDKDLADAACLRSVGNLEAKELLRRKPTDAARYDGILIPYFQVGEATPCTFRVRRNQPDLEFRAEGDEHGHEINKYMTPPGDPNHVYFPPGVTNEKLKDTAVPIVLTEGEFKTLSLDRLARHEMTTPRFIALGLSGVWNWRGKVGTRQDSAGRRQPVKGVLPEFDLIEWRGRNVYLAFDSDTVANHMVKTALKALTRELQKRQAVVHTVTWEPALGKGVDDVLVREQGPGLILDRIHHAEALDPWREDLIRNRHGSPLPILSNAMVALRQSPAWAGLLRYDSFKQKIITAAPAPWSGEPVGRWIDQHDMLLAEWLQHEGLIVTHQMASNAVVAVAMENAFDPVQEYLNSLTWDGTPRVDRWLTTYLGVKDTEYSRMVGRMFFLSLVARGLQPGCQADNMILLEGEQGAYKSSFIRRILPDKEWLSSNFPKIDGKDAMQALQGKWLIEISEFDKLDNADIRDVKSFLTNPVDSFRPPYGRHPADHPRRTILIGTTNARVYLKDPTGARRFWPVQVGTIDRDNFEVDRDQVFAEAVARFRNREQWWPDSAAEKLLAAVEQDLRYIEDDWTALVLGWCNNPVPTTPSYRDKDGGVRCDELVRSTPDKVFSAEVLQHAIRKLPGQWNRSDSMRVSDIFKKAGWTQARTAGERYYVPSVSTPKPAPAPSCVEVPF